jgi:hypothetical protein
MRGWRKAALKGAFFETALRTILVSRLHDVVIRVGMADPP